MRVLIVTRIFPNAKEPLSSPFNRQQFKALSQLASVEVLATIPWFPGVRRFAGKSPAAKLVDLPATDEIDGLSVAHPRFLYVPKLGHALGVPLYAASLLPHLWRRRNDFDVILGAWAYPDAAAIVALGRALRLPTVVKCHGSDINVVGERPSLRWQLGQLLPGANRVVVVSRALGEKVVALGVARDRLRVVYNGIDDALFRPRDRAESRRHVGLPQDKKIVLYVGRLEKEKGVIDLLDAWHKVFKARPDMELVLVGDGSARAHAERRSGESGGGIRLVGARPLAEIPDWLGACDVLTLPSWNEGTPNVVLEALASGRRVVASNVGGIPDLIDPNNDGDTTLGRLVPARAPDALADALVRAAEEWYDPAVLATRGSHGDWATSARHLHATLVEAVAEGPR